MLGSRKRNIALLAIFFLLPVVLAFVPSAAFYRWPMRIRVTLNDADILHSLAQPSLVMALLAALVWVTVCGVILIYTGRWLRKWCKPTTESQNFRLGVWGYVLLAVFGTIMAVAHAFIEFSPGLEQIVHQLALLPICAVAIAVYMLGWSEIKLSTSMRGMVLLIGIVAFCSVILLPAGLGKSAPVAYGLLIMLFLFANFKPRVLVLSVVAVMAISVVAIAMILKSEVREQLFGGVFERDVANAVSAQGARSRSNEGATKTGRLLGDQIEIFARYDPNYAQIRGFDRHDLRPEKFAVARVLHRLNHFGELAYVIEQTPKVVPYSGMATFRPLLYIWAPRFLFANKPRQESGQYFGHRYAFIGAEDVKTSVNMNIVVEAYMSAGWKGIVLTAALTGLFVATLWVFFVERQGVPGLLIIGGPVLYNLANTESGFVAVWGGAIYAAIIYGVLLWLLQGRILGRVFRGHP